MNGRFVKTDVPCWQSKDRRHELGGASPFCVRCGELVVECDERPSPTMVLPLSNHADKLYVIGLLAERDGLGCFYCTGPLLDPADDEDRLVLTVEGSRLPLHAQHPTIDHVIPRAAGGRSELGNMVLSCPACNERKGDQMTVLVEMVFDLRKRLSEYEDADRIMLTAPEKKVGYRLDRTVRKGD